jgi:NitT/TauT family transport system ATP-binding protein
VVVDGVTKSFASLTGALTFALRDVSLTVERDEFLAVVGPSGCGKTTLLKLLAGLIAPTRGRILTNGCPVTGPRADLGMVFQAPLLMSWRTVLQNVLFPVEMLRLPVSSHRARARELLYSVGLDAFEDAYPRELSGGMQHRVAICRALIHDPTLLLMDEPFAALDALTRQEMGLQLLRIWQERRKTVVFITHSIHEAVLLSDRVVVMTARPGRVVHVVPVGLPRPRVPEMESASEFTLYTSEIRREIFQPPVDPVR